MSDNAQELKILITSDATSAVDGLKQTATSSNNLTEAIEDTGKKVEDAGTKAGESGEKHRGLRHIMGELNRISPGLGEALEVLASSYKNAGTAAKGGAVGLAEFNAALEEVLLSLGPIIIAMLSVEAVMEYWDLYKEKVKGAAEAQEEATKRIVESTKSALESVRELDEAMHPKAQGMAAKDEAALKKNQADLENAYNRQRELNKAAEEKELQGAGSSGEKEQIKKRFELLDAQLNDWRDKQKAAVEGAMIGTMEKQLADLKAAENPLIQRAKPAYQMGLASGDMTRYNQIRDELKKNAEEAKGIREKLDGLSEQQATDSDNADFRSETNRQVFGAKGTKYNAPSAGYEVPTPDLAANDAANKFATGKDIADTAAAGGKVNDAQQQFLVVLEQSITGQKLTFDQAARLIEAQSRNHDFTVTLLERNVQKIEAVTARLRTLEGQMSNASFSSK